MSLRFKIFAFNAIIALLLLIVSSIGYFGISNLHSGNFWVDHTHKVIEKADHILGAAVDMETGMRGFMLAGKDEFLEPYSGGQSRFTNLISELKKTVSDNPPQVARLAGIENTISEWREKIAEPAIAFRREVGSSKTMDNVADLVGEARGKKYFDKFRGQIAEFQDIELKLMVTRQSEEENTYTSTISLLLIFSFVALFVALLVSFLLTNSIITPFKAIFGSLEKFSNKELKDIQGLFSNIIRSLKEHATNLNETSQDFSTSSSDLLDNTNSQASSIEETSASVHQVSSLVKNNSEEAQKTNHKIKDMQEYIAELHDLFQKIEESNTELKQIVSIIENIGEKTDIIDEIVFQTKLLSFNASVEAERAGEHGRGFAVVAQEVANLASMSGKSSVEISNIVKNGIKSCEGLVQGTTSKVNIASKRMKEIRELIDIVSTASNEISAASSEQTKGIEQVNEAIMQINSSTQSTTAIAKNVETAVNDLHSQSETIFGIISKLDQLLTQDKNSFAPNKNSNTPKANHPKPSTKNNNTNLVQMSKFNKETPSINQQTGTDGWDQI
ncbi:MAG: methyl-accepting chemotaxis protein [Oligoflexales bacterium]